jgi:hypothetical protein
MAEASLRGAGAALPGSPGVDVIIFLEFAEKNKFLSGGSFL